MCEMKFYGPLAEHKDNDKAKFSYMSLWGGPKALELFHNSALCNQKTSKNLLLVLKGTDQTGTFMSLKCVVYYANYRSGHQSSKIQV